MRIQLRQNNSRVNIRDAKVQPVSDDGSDGNSRGFDTDQETTVVRLGGLGDPGGDSGGVHAVSDTSNDTRDDELDETADVAVRRVAGAERGGGDDGSDDHDDTANDHHLTTTEFFTDKEGEEGAKEAADLINRNDGTLNCTGVDIVGVPLPCLQISISPRCGM